MEVSQLIYDFILIISRLVLPSKKVLYNSIRDKDCDADYRNSDA
jgi:hypothetical protein